MNCVCKRALCSVKKIELIKSLACSKSSKVSRDRNIHYLRSNWLLQISKDKSRGSTETRSQISKRTKDVFKVRALKLSKSKNKKNCLSKSWLKLKTKSAKQSLIKKDASLNISISKRFNRSGSREITFPLLKQATITICSTKIFTLRRSIRHLSTSKEAFWALMIIWATSVARQNSCYPWKRTQTMMKSRNRPPQ